MRDSEKARNTVPKETRVNSENIKNAQKFNENLMINVEK